MDLGNLGREGREQYNAQTAAIIVLLTFMDYDGLDSAIANTLNNCAPRKKKYVHTNDWPFMTKELRTAIVYLSMLLNRCRKNKTNDNLAAYKYQRNKCSKILRMAKVNYSSSLDSKYH